MFSVLESCFGVQNRLESGMVVSCNVETSYTFIEPRYVSDSDLENAPGMGAPNVASVDPNSGFRGGRIVSAGGLNERGDRGLDRVGKLGPECHQAGQIGVGRR